MPRDQIKPGAAPSRDANAPRAIYGSARHARHLDPSVPHHICFKTLQGLFLLRPDAKGLLNSIIAGVIARAQTVYPDVSLFAHAWLSNHAHLIVQGPPGQTAAFLGFIKREISRRWGPHIGWSGPMWQRSSSTALPTPESQQHALQYVLAQGTKEHLVSSPLSWPGVNSARELVRGKPRQGGWFDGTGYSRACDAQRRSKAPKPVRRDEYLRKCRVLLRAIPSQAHLSKRAYREYVHRLVQAIKASATRERRHTGKRVLGRRSILTTPRHQRSKAPRVPWLARRRRLICWADRAAAETKAYVQRYWEFQTRFREASTRFRAGELDVPFPPGAFRPPRYEASG